MCKQKFSDRFLTGLKPLKKQLPRQKKTDFHKGRAGYNKKIIKPAYQVFGINRVKRSLKVSDSLVVNLVHSLSSRRVSLQVFMRKKTISDIH
jgi:hypothetical protein